MSGLHCVKANYQIDSALLEVITRDTRWRPIAVVLSREVVLVTQNKPEARNQC